MAAPTVWDVAMSSTSIRSTLTASASLEAPRIAAIPESITYTRSVGRAVAWLAMTASRFISCGT